MDKEDNKSGVNEDESNEQADQVNDLPAISPKNNNANGQAAASSGGAAATDSYTIEDNPPPVAKMHDHSQSMTVLPSNSIAKDVENYNNSNSNTASGAVASQGKAAKGANLVSRFRSGTIEKIDKIKNFVNNASSNSETSQSNDNSNGQNDSPDQGAQATPQTNGAAAANGTSAAGNDSNNGDSSSKKSKSSKDKDSSKSSKKSDNTANGSHKSNGHASKGSKSKDKKGHNRESSNSHHRRNPSKTDKTSSSHSRHSKKSSKIGHSRTGSKSKNKVAEPRRKSMIPIASSEKRSRSNGPPNGDDNSGKKHGTRHSQQVTGALANGHHKHRHGSTTGSKKERRSKKDKKERKQTYAGSTHGDKNKKKHGKHKSSAATGSSSSSSSRSGQISSGVQTDKNGKKRNLYGGSFIWDENTNLEAKIMYRLKNEIFYIFSYYEPVRIVGSGAYAVVLEAIDKRNNKHVAIKKNKHVFEDVRDARRILREIKLLMHFDKHEDIIELIDTVPPGVDEMSSFSDIYLVTPLLESNLEKIINSKQPLTNLHYQYLTYQILRGLKYIHSTGVIHRDIKPENILVNGADCNVKIIDFGLARGVCKDDDDEFKAANTEYVCTRWYRSPEVMCNAGYYDEKMDIWGVGCILAEMVLRRPLFPGNNYMDQLRHIFDIMGTPKETEWIKSDQAKAWVLKLKPHEGRDFKKYFGKAFDKEADMLNCIDLLQKLLEINPNKRISAAEAIDHIYFKGMHDRKAEKTGEKFDLSFEFENKIATKFGVRHMLCESLTKFHKQIRKKEKRELAKLKKKLKEKREQKKREKLKAQQEKEAIANGTANGSHDTDSKEKSDNNGGDANNSGDPKDNSGNESSGAISSDDKEHKHSRHHKHHKHKHSKHKSRSKHKSKHGKTNDDNVSESADLDSDLDEDAQSPKKKKDETAL